MAYTYTDRVGDGHTTTFSFRFAGKDKAYIRASDIRVEAKTNGSWTTLTNWQLSGTNQITFTAPPANGVTIRIRRVVGKEMPYAEFDRGVMLDMKSLNNAFIQQLEVTQEILDGFLPDDFHFKQDLNMGGHRITNLGEGQEPTDAATKGSVDEVDKKQTDWNQIQDDLIDSLRHSLTSDVASRTIPWYFNGEGGESVLLPPFKFNSALVFRQGVLQHELAGAVAVSEGRIELAEPLRKGEQVYALLGSRIAAPTEAATEIIKEVQEGQLTVDLGLEVEALVVSLDGLRQTTRAYELVNNRQVVFNEELPECTFSALVVTKAKA